MRSPEPHEELLGLLMNRPVLFQEVRGTLQPHMFREYEGLYKGLSELETIPNFIILKRKLPQWSEVIEEIFQATTYVTANFLQHLLTTVKNTALKDDVVKLCRDMMERVHIASGDELLRELQERSIGLQTAELGKLQNPVEDVDDYFNYLERIIDDPSTAFGLMTGNVDLDRMTTGWHRQDFSVIGARTSIGKSAFALDNIMNLNENGYKCAIFSLEMSKKQIYNRMVANRTGYSLEAIRTGQIDRANLPKIKALRSKLEAIYIDDTRGVSADYIIDTMRQLNRSTGLDFVLTDYLQDIKETGEQNDNGGSALARVCRKLRKGAQEMDCHVQGLSQIDRRVEQRQDKRPFNSDLTGSAGIESSADVIAMLYRDDYYNGDTDKKNIMEVVFTKQRNGKVGLVELAFLKDSQQMKPLDRSR